MKKLLLSLVGFVLTAGAFAESLLMCQFVQGANPATVAARYGYNLLDTTDNNLFGIFSFANENAMNDARSVLEHDNEVVWAEEDYECEAPENQSAVRGSTIPAVGDRTALYQRNVGMLAQIGWKQTLAFSSGRTVKVAILDNGLAPSQAYLWDKVDASINYMEEGTPAYDQPLGQDSNLNGELDEAVGHGTMVAGIIDQIAPRSRFVVARVADSDGNASAWSIVKGVAYAVDQGAEVINLSLGADVKMRGLKEMLNWVEAKNVILVAAAGNLNKAEGLNPSHFDEAVMVSGLLPNNRKAPFSNYDRQCDVAAPATGIVSQWWDGQMGTWSGTSFSTPMVAGAIADCLRRTTPATPFTIRRALRASGVNIDRLNPAYRRKIGSLLHIARLDQALKAYNK